MDVKHNIQNIKLTSGEISELFNTYLHNSASIPVLSYLAEKTQDPDASTLVESSLKASKEMVKQISDIFKSENHPLPKGFSEEDAYLNAKKLFSDTFTLYFLRFMARFGLTQYAEARALCTRSDVRSFFNNSIQSTLNLFNMADDILLAKGIYTKPPIVPIPQSIDPVEDQSILKGFFGEKRPLNAAEIGRIHLNFQRNSLGKAFLMGLSQTTRNKEVQDYLIRGMKLAKEHTDKMTSLLIKDDLPVPENLDSEVTESTDPIFSDKLIIFFVVALDALGIATDGITLSRAMRRDLAVIVNGLITDIGLYAEDGVQLMIKHKWLEKIPEAANRQELIGV